MEGAVERCWHRCQYNIKIDLKDVGYEGGFNWLSIRSSEVPCYLSRYRRGREFLYQLQ